MSAALATLSRPAASAVPTAPLWLDGLSCDLFESGTLARLVAAGLHGMSSNPAATHAAIRSCPAYQAVLPALRAAHTGAQDRLDALVLPDVRRACDLLAATHEGSAGRAGFVSIGLSPFLADDTAALVAAAQRLRAAVARPNLLVQVPATEAGIAALEELVCAGVGVNATLVFTRRQAAAVRAAHRRGLARRLQATLSVQRIACVMTMVPGSLDAAVDAQLCACAAALRGSAGAASAQLALRDLDEDTGFAIFAAFGAAQPLLALEATRLRLPGAVCIGGAMELQAGSENTTCLQTDTGDALATVAQLARHGVDLETIGNDALAAALTQSRQTQRNLLALMG